MIEAQEMKTVMFIVEQEFGAAALDLACKWIEDDDELGAIAADYEGQALVWDLLIYAELRKLDAVEYSPRANVRSIRMKALIKVIQENAAFRARLEYSRVQLVSMLESYFSIHAPWMTAGEPLLFAKVNQ